MLEYIVLGHGVGCILRVNRHMRLGRRGGDVVFRMHENVASAQKVNFGKRGIVADALEEGGIAIHGIAGDLI